MRLNVAVLMGGRIIKAFRKLDPETEAALPERLKVYAVDESRFDESKRPKGSACEQEPERDGYEPEEEMPPRPSRRGTFELNTPYRPEEMPTADELLLDEIEAERAAEEESLKAGLEEARANHRANVQQEMMRKRVAAEASDQAAEAAIEESENGSEKADWEGSRPPQPLRAKLKAKPKPKRRKR